jgi:hypothetical protein
MRTYKDGYDMETTHIVIEPEGKHKVSKFTLYRRAILGCIAGVFVTIGAIFSVQGPATVQNAPVVQAVTATDYRLVEAYQTTVAVDGITCRVSVAAGFVTDGASIPRAVQTALGLNPFSPTLIRGALVHDALYRSERLPRATADRILKVLVLEDGTHPRKAEEIYAKVRQFGALIWAEHRDAEVMAAREFVKVEVVK